MTTAPTDDLVRSVPFALERADDEDGLTLAGYAAVFNARTTIDSWEGLFEEEVAPGAFKKSLRERTPLMQFDHGHHPMVGSLPIGQIKTLREDAEGLYVEARLHDNWMVEPVRDAIASGAIDGMSFRFSVVQEKWSDRAGMLPLRTLKEVKLFEVGPVVWPAYEQTSVGVRAREIAAAFTSDPAFRNEIARAVLLGTSDIEPALPLDDEAALEVGPQDAPASGLALARAITQLSALRG